LHLAILSDPAHNANMKKRPGRKPEVLDISQFAARITEMAMGEPAGPPPKSEREKNPAAVALGKLGGAKGGHARAAKMTKKQRSEAAKKAAAARWNQIKKTKNH
jgi:hypothetical protein